MCHNYIIGLVSECPTVTVHAGKRFKAIIDSEAALSQVHTSVYSIIEFCYKTKIINKPKNSWWICNVFTGQGYLTSLHSYLQVFWYLCHMWQLTGHSTDILFGIDIQRRCCLSYSWDLDKQLFIQREGLFLTYTRNCEQQHYIAVVKSSLEITPRHNGMISVTIKGHNLKASVEYFISNQHINKRLDPNIHVIDGIYNIKDRLTLHVLAANYTNKHFTFNKGQCVGHIEPSIDHMMQTAINSLAIQKMIDKHVQPHTFTPSLHTLLGKVRKSLNQLLETFKSQFAQDEINIETTYLTITQIDTGNSKHVSQKPYPIAMKHYAWVRNKINKFLDAQGRWRKMLSNWLQSFE